MNTQTKTICLHNGILLSNKKIILACFTTWINFRVYPVKQDRYETEALCDFLLIRDTQGSQISHNGGTRTGKEKGEVSTELCSALRGPGDG